MRTLLRMSTNMFGSSSLHRTTARLRCSIRRAVESDVSIKRRHVITLKAKEPSPSALRSAQRDTQLQKRGAGVRGSDPHGRAGRHQELHFRQILIMTI